MPVLTKELTSVSESDSVSDPSELELEPLSPPAFAPTLSSSSDVEPSFSFCKEI